MYFSFSRTIKLAKENSLPSSKLQSSIFKYNHFGTAYYRSHYVGRGVSFEVLIAHACWDNFLEGGNDIFLNGRVRSFIDGQRGRGVGVVQETDAGLTPRGAYGPIDLSRYVH